MRYVFLLLTLAMTEIAAGNPPGYKMQDATIFLPANYVNSFFSCPAPDSARIYFHRTLPLLSDMKDSSSRLFQLIRKKEALKAESPIQDYRQFLNEALELGYPYSYMLFYKTAFTGKHHKVRFHNPRGKLKRELLFTDPRLRLFQETVFF